MIDKCVKKQFILAGSLFPNATTSPQPFAVLQKSFPGLVQISSENCGKIPENLHFNTVHVGDGSSSDAMSQLLGIIKGNRGQRFVVFSNFVSRCMDIHTEVQKQGVTSALMLSDMDMEERLEEYLKFGRGSQVLVSIDIAARGLEMDADHVVLYNLPKTANSLVNRIGRVGRRGKKAEVTVFLGRDEAEIETMLRPGKKWEDVFKFYGLRTKKKIKFPSLLEIDIDETANE
jgi:superfamily II DNA/RNA helicase